MKVFWWFMCLRVYKEWSQIYWENASIST